MNFSTNFMQVFLIEIHEYVARIKRTENVIVSSINFGCVSVCALYFHRKSKQSNNSEIKYLKAFKTPNHQKCLRERKTFTYDITSATRESSDTSFWSLSFVRMEN
jgi:hypothetical protein